MYCHYIDWCIREYPLFRVSFIRGFTSQFMQVGERVSVGGSRTGTLRFAGTVKFAPGYVISLSC